MHAHTCQSSHPATLSPMTPSTAVSGLKPGCLYLLTLRQAPWLNVLSCGLSYDQLCEAKAACLFQLW